MRGPAIRTDAVLGKPDFTQPVVLTTGSSNSVVLDVPAGAGFFNLSCNVDVWVSYGSTVANIPSTNSTAGTSTAEFNPTIRNLGSTQSCTGIAIASEFAGKGSISWFKPA